MDALLDLQNYLEAEGIAGESTAWGLVRGGFHDDQDQVVAIVDDGGLAPEIGAASGIGDESTRDPSVQFMVRGAPYDRDASQGKAEEIFEALHGLLGVTLGSTYFYRIAANTASPIFAGRDENNRPIHTISFRCMTAVSVPT